MIFGLQTWWLPAIGTPFMEFHASLWSILIGILVTLVVILNTIRGTVAKIGRASTTSLLAGVTDFDEAKIKLKSEKTNVSGNLIGKIAFFIIGLWCGTLGGRRLFTDGWSGLVVLIVMAVILIFAFRSGLRKAREAHPNLTPQNIKSFALFSCIGAIIGVVIVNFVFIAWIHDKILALFEHPITQFLMFTVSILGIGWLLFERWLTSQNVPDRLNRARFALKNAARQPNRSKTCVTTISLACCIIVAVGANRHDAPPETEYAFVAESALPLHHSLNTPNGKFELGFSEEDSERLSESEIFPFRVLPGEDASCLNLYQPQKPQILGAPDAMLDDTLGIK